ncbi:MAG: M48 family metalloprotease [Pseudomonadales bacterium]|nr:M48 family metalloprotease [Pseudomonadales bacterium]
MITLVWFASLLALIAWMVSALFTPLVLNGIERAGAEPRLRGRRVLVVAALPLLAAMGVGGSMLMVIVGKAAGWIDDHCLEHGPGHPHLCLHHLPALALNPGLWLPQAAALIALLIGQLRAVGQEVSVGRALASVSALSRRRGVLRIAEFARPLAVAHGLRRPVVLLSRGLLSGLDARQRRIVLAHEAAHLRAGHPRWSLLLLLLSVFHLPKARHALAEAWSAAREHVADDEVARRFGAQDVAETLARVARFRPVDSSVAVSVAGHDPLARAWRLIEPRSFDDGGGQWFEAGVACAGSALAASILIGHHAMETLLGLLVGAG